MKTKLWNHRPGPPLSILPACCLILAFASISEAANNGNSDGNSNGNSSSSGTSSGTNNSSSSTTGTLGDTTATVTGTVTGAGKATGTVTGTTTTSSGQTGTVEAEVVLDLNGGLGTASDGVVLGAPGVGLNYRVIDTLPFSETANLGRYYRYTFTGIEVQADADGIPGIYAYDGLMWDKAKKNNNGHGNNCDGVDSSNPGKSKEGLDSDPTVDDECKGKGNGNGNGTPSPVVGWWQMWGRVNNIEARNLTFSSPQLNHLSAVLRLYLSAPVVFKEQVIEINWSGTGNSQDPDGHFYLLGSAIKEPPVPIGQLTFSQTLYKNGTKPPFTWNVVRE